MAEHPKVAPLVSPLNWLALAAVGVMLLVAALWACTATIPRMVEGRGVIIRDSEFGIFEVEAPRSGTLDRVFVREGDIVTAGQPMAELRRSALRIEISTLEQEILSPQLTESQRTALDSQLRELRSRLAAEQFIRSARDGRVIEVTLSAGHVIKPGDTILRMESISGKHEALVYVSAVEGKKILPGMEARIVPTAEGTEKSGYLKAKVSYVSPQPVTRDYLIRELGGNERLADWLMEQGARTEVVIEPIPDPSQPDGYAWSSGKPSVRIDSGLLLEARVIFDHIHPISWWLSPDRE